MDAWDLMKLLAVEVHTRSAAFRVTDKAAKDAIAQNARTSSAVTEAVAAYRVLSASLAGNAGLDKGQPLERAILEPCGILGINPDAVDTDR
jgi:hypothetical protein